MIAGRAGVPSIEYFAIARKRLESSNSPNKAKEIDKLIHAYETASRKMEAEAAKLPKGSLERKYLLSAQAKMNNIIGLIPPYEKSPIIRSEQRDWSLVPLPGAKPSGFSRILCEWDRQAGYSADESEIMQNAFLQGGRTSLNGGRSVGRRQTPSEKAQPRKPNPQTELHNQERIQNEINALGRIGINSGKSVNDLRYKPAQSTLQIRHFRKQVLEARKTVPSNPRRKGNVAVAAIDIEGISIKQIAGHSGINTPQGAFVGAGHTNFKSLKIPNNRENIIDRKTDSEYKILSNLTDTLGNNYKAKGSVTIFAERAACSSCKGVADQFKQRYPNIEELMISVLEVITNAGRSAEVHESCLNKIYEILSKYPIEELVKDLEEDEKEEFIAELNLVLDNSKLQQS